MCYLIDTAIVSHVVLISLFGFFPVGDGRGRGVYAGKCGWCKSYVAENKWTCMIFMEHGFGILD